MNRVEHLLSIVAEECCEVGQRISKANRFGLNEAQSQGLGDNRTRLVEEIKDLYGIIKMLEDEGILPKIDDPDHFEYKRQKVEKYLLHSKACGTLSE